jgi:hypothetical protein
MSFSVSQILDDKIQEVQKTFQRIQNETLNYTQQKCPIDMLHIDGVGDLNLEKKKRKSVECNGMEFLVALMLLYPITAENVFDRIQQLQQTGNSRFLCKPDDIEQYVVDLTHKQQMIPEYIPAFYRDIGMMGISLDEIETVYLTGKYQTFP